VLMSMRAMVPNRPELGATSWFAENRAGIHRAKNVGLSSVGKSTPASSLPVLAEYLDRQPIFSSLLLSSSIADLRRQRQCARLDSLRYRDGFGGLCWLWTVRDEES
jgi:hypothetical protein